MKTFPRGAGGLVFFLCLFALAAPAVSPADERIVAVGDIHGDLAAFLSILQKTGLTDSSGRWTGGTAILVQTGDFTDRGPNVRAVMDLLMTLEKEATRQGGRVHVLLGS